MQVMMKVSQAARLLERSERWLRDAERKGKIPKARRDFNGWRFYTDEDITNLRKCILGVNNQTKS
ncbi:MerR family transcriptional regulator [Chloroflexota bacterium]